MSRETTAAKNEQETWPFAAVAVGWLLVSALWCRSAGTEGLVSLAALWAAGTANLLALTALGRALLAVMASEGQASARVWSLGLIKVSSLAALAAVIWLLREAPLRSILCGAATLVVVPLLGGMWSFQRKSGYAS